MADERQTYRMVDLVHAIRGYLDDLASDAANFSRDFGPTVEIPSCFRRRCFCHQFTMAFPESSCMRISLTISTRNRASQLGKVLQHLCTIERSFEHELLIVDNASTDHTSAPELRWHPAATGD